ncbi:apolipoprotein N-acyltransferase [Actinoallomurus rhizosphaericola]|uniref:apolipoprotein N-acyltransferase n=1 Tax=Actinoallomurus rhizosphaericola TaxID=2952536 RepID=UPI002091B869|nr:apolipoprotein N-acyltransferase [Actinoallomurus rhizosphaericola]MCO5993648.1 apolipoprotein N-acyltransferase [Actinoallomurus rhizosphaericola]
MRTAAERAGPSGPAPDEQPPTARGARARPRLAALVAGALPVLAFPRAGLDWLAWVALVPGLLLVRAAASGREAAVRGWWFGAGFLAAALYWLIPDLGPALVLVAAGAGVLWAGWGYAAWALLRPGRLLAAAVVVPSAWVVGEWARSWHALGGPWALYGATQWRHPAVLSLASLGGVWLVTFALVAVNVAVAVVLVTRSAPAAILAVLLALSGPVLYTPSSAAAGRPLRVALVQPGVVDGPDRRFADGERITSGLPAVDLVVWGESSVGFDLDRRPDLVARLTALARAHGPLLVNQDARDASGRIAKSAVLIGPDGVRGRYVKNLLVPFGEYIPLRRELGWIARVSQAAKEDRLPGTGLVLMRAGGGPDAVTFGPLVCFESAFPDLSRAVVRRGARLIVYESATSSFQDSWSPAQHASLGALRAAETGRPVVQAALTGVSAAFDAKGRRLAWFDTSRRGSVVAEITPAGGRTPYDRFGDYVPWLAAGVVLVSGGFAVRRRRGR